MTQIQQPSLIPGPGDPAPEGEATPQVFEPILPNSAPANRSWKPLLALGASVAVLVGGLIFSTGKPDGAEAEDAVPDYATMSVDELVADAGMPAARELVRRQFEGTAAEQADASRVFDNPPTNRLRRNLVMAMALQQQKKAQQRMLQVQRHQRMAESGYGQR